MTDDDMAALQVRIAAYAAESQRKADAYRETFHYMLGWLERPRQVSSADVVLKMREVFDRAVL